MKKIFLFLFISTLTLSLSAQKLTFGLNFYTANPQGDYNFLYSGSNVSSPPGIGLGAGFEMNYWLNDRISLGFSYGNMTFQTREGTIAFIGFLRLPLEATALSKPMALNARYSFFTGRWKPYVGIGGGYAVYSASKVFSTPAIAQLPASDIKMSWRQDGYFITPQIGLTFAIIKTIQVHLGVQYQIGLNSINGMHNINVDAGILGLATGLIPGLPLIPAGGEQQTKIDATNNLCINFGMLFTLFEKQQNNQTKQKSQKHEKLSSPRPY